VTLLNGTSLARYDWATILPRATEIVRSYAIGVTLRQLYYRLVAEALLVNVEASYKALSRVTARGREQGTFPDLIDPTRGIEYPFCFAGVVDAQRWLAETFRLDRTEGQPWTMVLGIEKRGLEGLVRSWFDAHGLPVVALGGFDSLSHVQDLQRYVARYDRPAVLLYAGDFDPSGEDIERDFVTRADCFAETHRVALTAAQVETYQLPPQPGKATDSRAAAFRERHGRLVQVEVDALPPDTLQGLYTAALAPYWDTSRYEAVCRRETHERRRLTRERGGA
jgi:hypothetical protein